MGINKWIARYAVLGGIWAMGCSGGASNPTGAAGGAAPSTGSAMGAGSSSVGSGSSGGGAVTTGTPQLGNDASAATTGGGVSVSMGDSGSNGDDGGTVDPEIAYTVTLTMDSFNVPAGQEVYMCQSFANPFSGMQADIKTYELHMSEGSHHMFAFYQDNATDTSVAACPEGGLQFAPFTFTAQSANVIQTYPEGVGATIPSTTGFTLNAHYVNTGSTDLTGQVSLTMHVAKPGIVTQHAGVIFLNQALLTVPTTATMANPSVSTSNFTLPQDVNIMFSSSHMHKRATNFIAQASTGQTLFSTTQWAEPPPDTYTPPMHLTAGTNIEWSCSYYNDTGQTLVFGESATTNVMCISVSIFYPVQDVTNPVISTQF